MAPSWTRFTNKDPYGVCLSIYWRSVEGKTWFINRQPWYCNASQTSYPEIKTQTPKKQRSKEDNPEGEVTTSSQQTPHPPRTSSSPWPTTATWCRRTRTPRWLASRADVLQQKWDSSSLKTMPSTPTLWSNRMQPISKFATRRHRLPVGPSLAAQSPLRDG